jgi:hypothetical protein
LKRSFLSLLLAIGLISSVSAQTSTEPNSTSPTSEKLDVSEFVTAYDNFIKAIDRIQNTSPSENSPDIAVKIIDAWTSAYSNLRSANKDFAKKHPEILTQTTPPPEILKCMSKLALMKTEYAPAIQRMNSLINQYGSYPKVQEAVIRYKASLEDPF